MLVRLLARWCHRHTLHGVATVTYVDPRGRTCLATFHGTIDRRQHPTRAAALEHIRNQINAEIPSAEQGQVTAFTLHPNQL